MLNELYKSVETKINEMKVYYKRVKGFAYTHDGWQFPKQYPSVSYNLTIEGMNVEEYTYNQHYRDDNDMMQFTKALWEGSGSIQTREFTYGRTGRVDYTKTGYSEYIFYKHPTPYIIELTLVTMAKSPRDDRALQEQILSTFGDRSYITVALPSFSDMEESYDMELQNPIMDESEYYARIMGGGKTDQRFYSRRYKYNIEGWLYFGISATQPGVISRFFQEYYITEEQVSTGYVSSSSFTATHTPDGA